MTLQRRVLLFLLLSAPLVWAVGLLYGLNRTRLEINELFDTQQVRLARQVLSTLPSASLGVIAAPAALAQTPKDALGAADVDDLSVAVWNRQGQLLLADREGVHLPHRRDVIGFVDQTIDDQAWRVYYQPAPSGEWLVAVGQESEERDELVQAILVGQLLPWVLTLPALLLAMAAAVRQALKPVRSLAEDLQQRKPDELKPLPVAELPEDLKPLVQAMNTLLTRIERHTEHERRFTADAAHELRTPLAALQAQWDAMRLSEAGRMGTAAEHKISQGLERLSRLVTQMLSLARLDHLNSRTAGLPIDWQTLVEQVFSELLPLAGRHRVELACEWPAYGSRPWPTHADSDLLAVLLRNLLDNAVRHSPVGATVRLRLLDTALEVVDAGPGVPQAQLARLGDRFFRLPGQADSGSGLGLSIALRIAALQGWQLSWHNLSGGAGFCVRLQPDG